MEALVYQGKNWELILVKQAQNFASVYIIMLITVNCLLTEMKSLSLKLAIKMLTFQINLDLVLLGLDKYLEMEMCMVFKSITILFKNLTH